MKNTFKKLMATTLSLLFIGFILSSWQPGASSDGQNGGFVERPAYGLLNDLPLKETTHD